MIRFIDLKYFRQNKSFVAHNYFFCIFTEVMKIARDEKICVIEVSWIPGHKNIARKKKPQKAARAKLDGTTKGYFQHPAVPYLQPPERQFSHEQTKTTRKFYASTTRHFSVQAQRKANSTRHTALCWCGTQVGLAMRVADGICSAWTSHSFACLASASFSIPSGTRPGETAQAGVLHLPSLTFNSSKFVVPLIIHIYGVHAATPQSPQEASRAISY